MSVLKGFICLLLSVLAGCGLHSTRILTTPSSGNDTSEPLLGIDVSHYQGDINWIAVSKTDVKFAFLKATQGEHGVDPAFHKNWERAKQTPLLIGVYHYLNSDEDGVRQAEHFIKTTQGNYGDFSPVIDIEALENEPPEEVIGVLAAFIAVLEQNSHCQPIIYTSHGFWSQLDDHDFGRYPLWLADYAKQPTLPQGWLDWQLWQFEENGTLSGISGSVDKNHLKLPAASRPPHFCHHPTPTST